MPCSQRNSTPSRSCVPLTSLTPSAEIMDVEVDTHTPNSPNHQNYIEKQESGFSRKATMSILTESTSTSSLSSHSSSALSHSPATSMTSHLYNESGDISPDSPKPTLPNAYLRPTRATFSIGINTASEGSSTSSSQRAREEGKGKAAERNLPYEDEGLDSSSDCSEREDKELSASVATIRPVICTPEPVDSFGKESTNASPNSDYSYTFEIRPPSSIFTTSGDDNPNFHVDSPILPQFNSPPSQDPILPHPAGLYASNSRRQSITSNPALYAFPPEPSSSTTRGRPFDQNVPQPSFDINPSSWYRPPKSARIDRRNADDSNSSPLLSWYRPSKSYRPGDDDALNGQVLERSTSAGHSPSLSPLAWDTTPVSQEYSSATTSTPLSSVNYLTSSWPPDTSQISPSNARLSIPTTFRSAHPSGREYEHHNTHAHPTHAGVSSSTTSSEAILTNPPSAPPRTTRSTVPLPPSTVHSSPSEPISSDSWGTMLETAFTPVEVPQPDLPGHPPWLQDPNVNAQPLPWASADWSGHPITASAPSPSYRAPPGYLLICSSCGSIPPCVCRRYVRVSPVTTGASAGLRTPIRHPLFWFVDGAVTFEVEGLYFKVHRYFFERHSEYMRSLLARRPTNSGPVCISDAKKLDFERLLKVFYPSNLTNPDLSTLEEWTSVLTLAVKWRMEEVMRLAIRELTPITTAVDKISLAKKFGLLGYNFVPSSNYNRDWLLPALRELCTRNSPLRHDEARKLDLWTVVKVWEVQHEIATLQLEHNAAQIERVIKRSFRLEYDTNPRY